MVQGSGVSVGPGVRAGGLEDGAQWAPRLLVLYNIISNASFTYSIVWTFAMTCCKERPGRTNTKVFHRRPCFAESAAPPRPSGCISGSAILVLDRISRCAAACTEPPRWASCMQHIVRLGVCRARQGNIVALN